MSSRGEGDVSVDVLESIAYTISIHALRVEGDAGAKVIGDAQKISIHALRVEGDDLAILARKNAQNFYPRPPGGGRRRPAPAELHRPYFYPRPPGGGRRARV